eukprot:3720625-Pyramimonas_sp.AAC.1
MYRAKEFHGQLWAAMLGIMASNGRVVKKGHPWAHQLQSDIDSLAAIEAGADLLEEAEHRLDRV